MCQDLWFFFKLVFAFIVQFVRSGSPCLVLVWCSAWFCSSASCLPNYTCSQSSSVSHFLHFLISPSSFILWSFSHSAICHYVLHAVSGFPPCLPQVSFCCLVAVASSHAIFVFFSFLKLWTAALNVGSWLLNKNWISQITQVAFMWHDIKVVEFEAAGWVSG